MPHILIDADGDCKTENLTSVINNARLNITVNICNYILRVRLNNQCGELRLVQFDHRGGFCDCCAVAFHDQRPSSAFQRPSST